MDKWITCKVKAINYKAFIHAANAGGAWATRQAVELLEGGADLKSTENLARVLVNANNYALERFSEESHEYNGSMPKPALFNASGVLSQAPNLLWYRSHCDTSVKLDVYDKSTIFEWDADACRDPGGHVYLHYRLWVYLKHLPDGNYCLRFPQFPYSAKLQKNDFCLEAVIKNGEVTWEDKGNTRPYSELEKLIDKYIDGDDDCGRCDTVALPELPNEKPFDEYHN